MDKERGENKYDGFAYYKPKLYSDPNSSYNTFFTNYLTDFCKKYEDIHNSEYYFLDLQGAYGMWGNMISKKIGAKKCIVTDYSEGMIEYGKTLYPESEAEFYNADFEKSLTDERITKYKYCGIIIKEAIHFTDAGYSARLMDFFKKHCTENAFIICVGLSKPKYWAEVTDFIPHSAMKEITDMRYDIIDFADEFREMTKNESGYKVESRIEPVPYIWLLDDFVYFLQNRSWSCFRVISEEELNEYIEKAKKKENNQIKFDIYYGISEITKQLKK